MNQNLTEIVFVLDRSGSMSHLADDTIGGFNTFIADQKKLDGEARLTTVLFDDKYEVLHSAIDIRAVEPITEKEYFARGMTALLDAVGRTINSIGERLANTPEDQRPAKVVFAITTDGHENASTEFNRQQIKDMIKHQTDKYGWQFMFLGANMDAVSEAATIGISASNSCTYTASAVGTASIYRAMSKGVEGLRGDQGSAGESGAVLDAAWKDGIE